jgi:hypothetical protein
MIQPKNTNNKTYANLPEEVTKSITDELAHTFEEAANKGSFLCQIRVYRTEMVFRAGYLKSGEIRQVNFDLSKEITPEKPEPIKTLEHLVAASKELFHGFFKEERIEDFSPLWAEVSGSDIYYRYDGTNTELESKANELLGEGALESDDDQMIRGDFSELEELEAIVETLTKNHKS